MKVSAPILESFAGVSAGEPGRAADLVRGVRSPEELDYALRRLVRGCASERRVAREGFFAALCALLAAEPSRVDHARLFDAIERELKTTGKSSDAGEVCAGRALACGAVLRSGLHSRCDEEQRTRTIRTLFEASERKSYLGLAAHLFVADYMKARDESEIEDELWPHIKERLSEPIENQTLDSLYTLLVLGERAPKLADELFEELFGGSSMFAEPAASSLVDKLMNLPEFSYVNHPIYETVGRALAESTHLIAFWKNGIESKLNVRNENRVLVVLTILEAILRNSDKNRDKIPQLLDGKFVPCILEWFRGFRSADSNDKPSKYKTKQNNFDRDSKSKQIVSKARRTFDALVEATKKEGTDPRVKLRTLNALLFDPGDVMFCDITSSKIVKTLIEDLNFDAVREFAETLKKIVSNGSKKGSNDSSGRFWTNVERLRATEMLTYLINHKTAEDVEWRIKNMRFLIEISLFKTTGSTDSSVSSELAAAVRKSFYRCLTFRLPKLETLLKILESLVKFIDKKLSNSTLVENNSKTFNPETLKSWKSTIKFSEKLEARVSEERSKVHTVFRILALHCGLLLFSDVLDSETSRSSLEEIRSCYDHYANSGESSRKKSNGLNNGEIVEDDPDWTEVLVDVFLSFLSRDSLLLRNIVQVVFRLLGEHLTPSAVGQILTVIDPDEEADLLSYRNKDDDEKDELDSSDERPDSDAEDVEKPEEEASDESQSESEEEDEEDVTVNDQLRMAVQKALGAAAPETDTESVDIDNMEEEEGKRIDDALSSAFKMLKRSKGEMTKKQKKNHKVLLEFRIRVLDLLHIYLEKNPTMEICLAMILPLFKCLEFAIKDSTQKPLEDKVRKCFKCLTSVKSFSSVDGVNADMLGDYLTSITKRGERTQFVFQALGDVVSKCGSFIIKCYQKLDLSKTPSKKSKKRKRESALTNIYKESLEAFFTKRDCLLPVIFFREALQIDWDGNRVLLDVVVDKTFDDAVRQFRRNEGLEMIKFFYACSKRNPNRECDEIPSFEKRFADKLVESLSGANKNAFNERFFCLLVKTLLFIKNHHDAKKLSDDFGWEKVTASVQEARGRMKLKNLQDYNKFCNAFKLEKLKNPVVEATETEEKDEKDSGLEETDEEPSKKERTEKPKGDGARENKRFSKKEAKRLRMMASSEGLENMSFSSLPRNVEATEENGVAETTEKAGSKKEKRKGDDSKVKRKKPKVDVD